MNMNLYNSPLPAISDVEKVTFWQFIGIASMLFSCHSRYSNYTVSNFFSSLSAAFKDKRVIVLVDSEKRPSGIAIYAKNTECLNSLYHVENIDSSDLIFESIVFPFSSPLLFYRFLKNYCLEHNIACNNAYLKDNKVTELRKIW